MPKKEFHEVTYAELTDAYVMITDDGYYHISFTLPTDKVKVIRSINVQTGTSGVGPRDMSPALNRTTPASLATGTTPQNATNPPHPNQPQPTDPQSGSSDQGGDHPAGKTTPSAHNHSTNPTPKHTDDEDIPF